MLRSDYCNCSNVYIVLRGILAVEGDNDDKTRNKKPIFEK